MSALTTTKGKGTNVPVTASEKGTTATSEWGVLVFAMRVGNPRFPVDLIKQLTVGDAKGVRFAAIPDALRKQTEQELDALASHVKARRAAVLTRVIEEQRVSKLEGTGYVAMQGGRITIDWIPTLDGHSQIVDYALSLLLDDSRPWGERFFRCQLETCRQFFVSPPPKHQGQFRYKYCSPEHQRDADRSKVAERVRRHRERQKK